VTFTVERPTCTCRLRSVQVYTPKAALTVLLCELHGLCACFFCEICSLTGMMRFYVQYSDRDIIKHTQLSRVVHSQWVGAWTRVLPLVQGSVVSVTGAEVSRRSDVIGPLWWIIEHCVMYWPLTSSQWVNYRAMFYNVTGTIRDARCRDINVSVTRATELLPRYFVSISIKTVFTPSLFQFFFVHWS